MGVISAEDRIRTEYELECEMQRLGLELQVSGDDLGWHVRVRGHDPTGAYHEVSYDCSDNWMTCAMLDAAKKFSATWGLA